MPRSSARLLVSLLALSMLVFVVGCPKKPPPEAPQTTPPVTEKPVPPAEEIPKEQGFEETREVPSTPIVEDQDTTIAKLNAQKVLGPVYFDFDKSDLKPDALDQLRKNADWLRANPTRRVRIEGNCDERGTVEYNLALADRRAAAAKTYLIRAGIDASRVETISYGEEHPVDAGHSESAWAKNRRDDFTIVR